MKGLRKIFILFLVIFYFLQVRNYLVFATEVVDRIVAIVDGEIITLMDLNQRLKPYLKQFQGRILTDQDKKIILKLKKKILDQMIDDILIKKVAEKYKLKVSDLEVKNYIDKIREENGLTLDEFKKQLKLQGLTYKQFYNKVKDDMLRNRIVSALVRRKVVVTDEEILNYYKKKFKQSMKKKFCLKIILLSSKGKAEEVYQKLKKGNLTFERAAQIYSIGPYKNGDLGCLNYSDLNSSWKKVLANLKPGEIALPFEFQNRWVILKLVKIKQESAKPLKNVKEKIRQEIYRQKFVKLFNEFIQKLRKDAVIDIKL
ncbi:MAG: SurA N-terminal domain-containing protein [Desulfonauticus sp.]|nr:SurA N-terminal domain-containing protein [Desulfonauticus sp.]